MDPITIAMAAAGGLKAVGALTSIFGAGQQYRQAKRVTRMKQMQLRDNADMVMRQSTFEQNRLQDQVDATLGAEVNFFAGGNLDPTSGSPAVLQAMSAAQGETDRQLIGARAVTQRADMFQQISDLESRLSDQRTGMSYGVATTLINTASDLLGMFGKPGGQGGSAFGFGGNAGTPIETPGNSFAAARRINGFQGWGV
jgi:hypothetical protein